MKNKNNRIYFPPILTILILFLLILTSGCAPLRPQTDPILDKKARGLADDILSSNQEITSSKGTGWVTLTTDTRKDKFKIAWAAQAPNRLRITFLMSGYPFETIVATGKHVTFISHTKEHKPYTTISSNPDLKKFIGIPVKLSEIIAILLGQIPVQRFDHAWFKADNSNYSSIVLAQNWKSTFQQIHLDTNKKVQQLLFLDKDDTRLYEITYLNYQSYGKNRIPVTLLIQDATGQKIHLSFTRFIPNPPIKESVFRLTAPGS
ncbi:MAG: DUF4292 domain-containing protein [Desulfobacteraceae bacterium]|nr:DUF4292 domain-containing protein [Desulfobacteraceae bacterium]